MAWTGIGIQPGRQLPSGRARSHRDPAWEAGERWGADTRGLCEQRPAGREGCASDIGCGLRGNKSSGGVGKGLGEMRDRRLGKVAGHSLGHWATTGEGVC
jgi:hypothetical protein